MANLRNILLTFYNNENGVREYITCTTKAAGDLDSCFGQGQNMSANTNVLVRVRKDPSLESTTSSTIKRNIEVRPPKPKTYTQ